MKAWRKRSLLCAVSAGILLFRYYMSLLTNIVNSSLDLPSSSAANNNWRGGKRRELAWRMAMMRAKMNLRAIWRLFAAWARWL